MFENCSCHVPDSSEDENTQGVKQSACKPCSAKTVKMMLAVLGGIVLIVVVLTQLAWSAPAASQGGNVALDGYCPICVTQMGKWVQGSPDHQATYDGKTYYFPSEREQEMFLLDPAKYVPALRGDCTVCYAKMGKRVPGDIRHAALHGGRLYLFPGDKQKQAFLASPQRFAIKGGAAERATVRPVSAEHEQIRIEGRSGCAGCEHGVTPIGAPNTLGLAVTTPDASVYVIEDAHRLYPQVYKDRFSGLKLSVSGEIVKQDGKIAWLRPTSLNVVN